GTFTSTMSLITLLVPLAVFGVAEFWLQRFGQEGYAAFRWVGPTLRVVVVTTALLAAAIIAWGLLDHSDPLGAQVRIALTPMLLALVGAALCASVLQLRGRYNALAALQLTPHAGRLTVAILVWLTAASVLAAAVGFAIAAAVTVLICLLVLLPFRRARVQ